MGGGQFSEAKLLLGWRGEKYHSNNSTREERRGGAGGDGEAVGMHRGGLAKKKKKKVSKSVRLQTVSGSTLENRAPYYG